MKIVDINAVLSAATEPVLAELKKGIDNQVAERAIAEIEFRLGGFGPKAGKADVEVIKAGVKRHVEEIDVAGTFRESQDLFARILSEGDYDAALCYYTGVRL